MDNQEGLNNAELKTALTKLRALNLENREAWRALEKASKSFGKTMQLFTQYTELPAHEKGRRAAIIRQLSRPMDPKEELEVLGDIQAEREAEDKDSYE